MTESKRIGILLFLYSRNELTSSEQKELQNWRKRDVENEELFFQMTDPESLRREMQEYYQDRDRGFAKLGLPLPDTKEMEQQENMGKEYPKPGSSVVNFWSDEISISEDPDEESTEEENSTSLKKKKTRKKRIRWMIAAAAIALTVWILDGIMSDSNAHNNVSMITPEGVRFDAGEFNRGRMAGEGHISFGETEKGEAIYIVTDRRNRKLDKYYTLMSGVSGEFLLQLPDGTRVWINAETAVKYPGNFGRDTINLELDGEAFIEVSKYARHMYVVRRFFSEGKATTANAPGTSLMLQPGTRLNFSTYGGNEMKLSMISGPAAEVNTMSLVTGMQGVIVRDSLMSTIPIDTAEVIAWKNGELYYTNMSIQDMMVPLAKWYGLEVKYQGAVPDKKYSIRLKRDAPVSELVDSLQKQGLHIIKMKKQLVFNSY